MATEEAFAGDFRARMSSVRVADKLTVRLGSGTFEAGMFFHHRKFKTYDLFDEEEFRLGVTDGHSDDFGVSTTWTQKGPLAGHSNEFIFGLAPASEKEWTVNHPNLAGKAEDSIRTAASVTRNLNLPLFAEDQFSATKNLTWVLGAQLVHAEREFKDLFLTDSAGDQSNEQSYCALNPKLGATYRLSGVDELFCNVRRNFQPPSFDDLTHFASGPSGSVVYRPLSAQSAWTMEAGRRGKYAGIDWDLSVYRTWLKNELLQLNDFSGRNLGTVNAGRTIHQGLEYSGKFDFFSKFGMDREVRPSLVLRGEYTLSDFHFDGDPLYKRNRIAGVPVHALEAELIYRSTKGFFFGPALQCNLSKYPADQANSQWIDRYVLVGFKVGRESVNGWTFFGEVKNLTDVHYAAAVSPIADARIAEADDLRIFSPGNGRSFFGGISRHW